MKPKLTDEISIQELLELRAEGKSNREIADLLDCSYATIYRHIGPSRKKKVGQDDAGMEICHKAPNPAFRETGTLYQFQVKGASYYVELNRKSGIAEITSGLNAATDAGLLIKQNSIDALIELLQELKRVEWSIEA